MIWKIKSHISAYCNEIRVSVTCLITAILTIENWYSKRLLFLFRHYFYWNHEVKYICEMLYNHQIAKLNTHKMFFSNPKCFFWIAKFNTFKVSTNSASNNKVVTRCSISSFLQVSIPGVCFTIFIKLTFSIFCKRKIHSLVDKIQASA